MSLRYETKEIAYIEVYGRHHGKMMAKLVNISASGAYFELSHSDYVPKPGDMLLVTVPLSSLKRSHIVHAQVVWGRGAAFGAQFVGKDDLIARMIQG